MFENLLYSVKANS